MAAMVSGAEVFVGAKRDPYFGPVVAFGGGGILVELVRDISCRLAPFDEQSARELIKATRVSRILHGYRGTRSLDVEALAKLLAAVSGIAAAPDAPAELDLNPVIVDERGAHIVDVRWMQ
jgi:acetyltransferase